MFKRSDFNMFLILASGFFVLTCITIQVPYSFLFVLAGLLCLYADYKRNGL